MKKNSAFSLLELVIVLALVMLILGAGITALISLRDNNTVRQARSEFIANYNTTRNKARNNVISDSAFTSGGSDTDILNAVNSIDYHAIYFDDDTYFTTTCDAQDLSGIISCAAATQEARSEIYERIEINLGNCTPPLNDPPLLLFRMSTGKLFLAGGGLDSVQIVENASSCDAKFNLPSGSTQTITLEFGSDDELAI